MISPSESGTTSAGTPPRTRPGWPVRVLAAIGSHRRRYWLGLSRIGLAFAMVFFCFSMTPSLLPRSGTCRAWPAASASGAVWVGTPRFTPLWAKATASRQSGSSEQVPDIDDCTTVCFAGTAAELPTDQQPKVVYLQHATDPIVWWSANLLFREPDWLAEDDRTGLSNRVTWLPVVTFWQVTSDMVFSSAMPYGYGHRYGLELANAWATVVPPTGWTPADTDRLRAVVADITP